MRPASLLVNHFDWEICLVQSCSQDTKTEKGDNRLLLQNKSNHTWDITNSEQSCGLYQPFRANFDKQNSSAQAWTFFLEKNQIFIRRIFLIMFANERTDPNNWNTVSCPSTSPSTKWSSAIVMWLTAAVTRREHRYLPFTEYWCSTGFSWCQHGQLWLGMLIIKVNHLKRHFGNVFWQIWPEEVQWTFGAL